MSEPRKFVMAGDHRQFELYRRSRGLSPRNVTYLSDERAIYGHQGGILIQTGNWYQRNDVEKIQRLIDDRLFSEIRQEPIFPESDINNREFITLVCGFPRCGSSLTMQMLKAGGMPLFYDDDKSLSYETDWNKKLPNETEWLKDCYGKAVKILEPLHHTPPKSYTYRAIWLSRNFEQQAKSTIKFAKKIAGIRIPKNFKDKLILSFKEDAAPSISLLSDLTNGPVLQLSFEQLIMRPMESAGRLAEFIGGGLDIQEMAKAVIKRSPDCMMGFLEQKLVEQEESQLVQTVHQ